MLTRAGSNWSEADIRRARERTAPRLLTQTGNRRAQNPVWQQSPAILSCAMLLPHAREMPVGETARVHIASRRRGDGDVAARGARAAAQADATHRRAHALDRERPASANPVRGVSARAATIRMDRWNQR